MTFMLFVPIDFVSALAIAACLTPTDPIICSIIVGASVIAPQGYPVNCEHRWQVGGQKCTRKIAAYPLSGIGH